MKKFLTIILAIVMTFALAACGSSSDSSSDVDLSEITVDEAAGTVTIYATINGSFFDTSTMHYIVNSNGSVAESAMMTSEAGSQEFYDAMVEAGGTPGNTESNTISDGEYVTGQDVEVTLTWDGQDEPISLADSVTTDGDLNLNMVFVGNKDNNAEVGSGCIACLNSCYAGITANNGLAYNDITSGKVKAYLNKDTMPDDGTVVQVTFTLK